MNIHAIGQNMLFGKVGHFLIILSFVTSLAASIAYFFATINRNDTSKSFPWINLGRKMFVLHA
ncbi:MAG: hypothetical protein KA322_04375, partial [Chitinophagales bacterium]|nr:hypothetical protein [Chitinophagales bacterium]